MSTERDDHEALEFKMMRFIVRIMFVWFIKQKSLVPDGFFEATTLKTLLKDFDPLSMTKGEYYNAILQNLFFATLNCEVSKRAFAHRSGQTDAKNLYRYAELFTCSDEQDILALFQSVPFLNGGLFECQDKTRTLDGVLYYRDGFSRNNETFNDGCYKYRATIPNRYFFDEEKGLLQLFQRYNFTVEENSSIDTVIALDPELLGNVFENLLAAYNPETGEQARKATGSFYTPRRVVDEMVDDSLRMYLGDATGAEWVVRLKTVKILDPTCGSGAFPMGLLNRMVELIRIEDIGVDVYALKRELIEHCIYGVDIQPIVTQISRLRCFITFICEVHWNDSLPNYGVPVLPNLECHFVTADGLKALPTDVMNICRNNPAVLDCLEQLQRLREAHFRASSWSEKKSLHDQDESLRKQLLQLMQSLGFGTDEYARQLALWNPYDQNSVAPFFDPEQMFGVKRDTFDIVIANPPYINFSKHKTLSAKYQSDEFQTYDSNGDIYCLFYEKAVNILRPNGVLCYITSDKWLRAGYGKKLRDFLGTNVGVKVLREMGGGVFENATVDTAILVGVKGGTHALPLPTDGSAWVLLSPIEQTIKSKVEAKGVPLKEWSDLRINRGILTGCNEAFIISTAVRDGILAACGSPEERSRTEALIRPILRGRDIKRYGYDWAGQWVINTHNGYEGVPRIDINDYPAVKAHLDKYKAAISKRSDHGDTIYNLRSCAYLGDFGKGKIVWASVGATEYSYVEEPMFLLDTNYFFTCSDAKIFYTLLNSKPIRYLINLKDTPIGEGGAYRHYKYNLEQLLLPPLSSADVAWFSSKVDELLALRSAGKDTHSVEYEIDVRICDLYDLNGKEREYILGL